MAAKYQALGDVLAGSAEPSVRFTFTEVDAIVGGLPHSARQHRTWWGNSTRHPHAAAWIAAGWVVETVDLDQQFVRFSRGTPQARGSTGKAVIMDGSAALDQVLHQAGFATVEAAVARHTVFLHPDTVRQTGGSAIVPVVRDPTRRGEIERRADGTTVLYCDNQSATDVFLWAADRVKGPDVQFNHVWNTANDPAAFTALWNICCTPAFLAKTTDTHLGITALLAYRSFDLYGYVPVGYPTPARPAGYELLEWHPMPPPVADLAARLRRRMKAAPRSRASTAAQQIGWLYADGPDQSLRP